MLGVECGWNSLWVSWLVLLVVLVVLDGFDLVLSFIKQHHDLLSSSYAGSPAVKNIH